MPTRWRVKVGGNLFWNCWKTCNRGNKHRQIKNVVLESRRIQESEKETGDGRA